MPSNKLIVVLLIALLGLGNLIVGIWSFVTINSLNLTTRLSTLSSQLDSFDVTLVKTAELQEPLTTLKNSALEELNFLGTYSEMLGIIPIYFIVMGAILLSIAMIVHFLIPE